MQFGLANVGLIWDGQSRFRLARQHWGWGWLGLGWPDLPIVGFKHVWPPSLTCSRRGVDSRSIEGRPKADQKSIQGRSKASQTSTQSRTHCQRKVEPRPTKYLPKVDPKPSLSNRPIVADSTQVDCFARTVFCWEESQKHLWLQTM